MNPTSNGTRFLVQDRALEALALLREPLTALRRRRRALADQLERAATSVLLNLAEGAERRGADRVQCYRIAAGSAAEARAALMAATALGIVDGPAVVAAADRFAQVVAMLWRITR